VKFVNENMYSHGRGYISNPFHRPLHEFQEVAPP